MDTVQVPASVEAETALLGALLIEPEVAYEIVHLLEPDDFYEPRHRVIYQAICDLVASGEAVDSVVVIERLKESGALDRAGGVAYITALVEGTPEASHCEQYAQIVKQKSVLRHLIRVCTKIREECFKQERPLEELLDEAGRMVYEVGTTFVTREAVHMRDILMETFKKIDELARSGERLVTGIPSGFYDLDEKTGGFQKGDLIVLAARPSMGKTTLALNIAERVAVHQRKPVAIFSIETSAERVTESILCLHTKTNLARLRQGRLSAEEFERISLGIGELAEAPIFINDANPLTPMLLKSIARRLKQKHDIQLLIVDYLQLMTVPGEKDRQKMVAQISGHLKGLAKELNIPVIAISQLRRAAEEHERPRLSDLRESGAIEQDADVVLLLWRSDYHEQNAPPRGEAELIIAKQRHGPRGVVYLFYDFSVLRFENAHPQGEVLDEELDSIGT
ncbi:MAG: replicative DNA helicase [Planctomycetota bacterium]|nr:MAG: replicative DNA helicase [Planctomycetota bacterium]